MPFSSCHTSASISPRAGVSACCQTHRHRCQGQWEMCCGCWQVLGPPQSTGGSTKQYWGATEQHWGCHQAALCAQALLHRAPREVLSSPTSTSRLSCCKRPLVSVRVVAVRLHVASGALWVVCWNALMPLGGFLLLPWASPSFLLLLLYPTSPGHGLPHSACVVKALY